MSDPTDAEALLPCPFCGGEASEEHVTKGESFGASYITCKRCWASTALHFDRKENLVSDWNRRAALPSRAEIEREARERALAVPGVWSEEERDGLSAAFTKASERHGHYESLFAAVAWFLRHRLALIPQEPQS